MIGLAILIPSAALAQLPSRAQATNVKITVLSTTLVGAAGANGSGERGFAALLEVDGRRILIDTARVPKPCYAMPKS